MKKDNYEVVTRQVRYTCVFLDKTINFIFIFFFFNDTATTEIYTLSLHDALPISHRGAVNHVLRQVGLELPLNFREVRQIEVVTHQ